MSEKRSGKTADQILDIAEELVQIRGYNAFSYADIARTLGIRKASLHHHFATKGDLGEALIDRYRKSFMGALEAIEAQAPDAHERLVRYVEIYRVVLRRGRMCLCGMLATDVDTLPEAMREGIAGFFADNESWLVRVFADGDRLGQVRVAGSPASMAALFVSSLEGAMFVARASGHPGQFDDVVRLLLDYVRPPAPRDRAPGI